MQNTTNFNLQKPDYNNVADIGVLNDNFDKIDNGIAPFFVATLKSSNVYEVTTGVNITSISDGFGIRVAIPSDSTGAVSIIIDGLTAVPVKKPNGGAVSNFKANGVYALTYYNGNFILVSGGGCDGDKVTATERDVLINKTFIGSDEEIHTGSMPEHGTVTKQLAINETFTLGEGHINSVKITQNIPVKEGHQVATNKAYWSAGSNGNTNPCIFLKPLMPAYYRDNETWIKQEVPDLRPENIVSGKNILGCVGTATIESLGGKYYKTGTSTCTKSGNEFRTNIAQYLSFTPRIIVGHVNTSIGVRYFYWNNIPDEKVLLYYADAFSEYARYAVITTQELNASSVLVFSSGNEYTNDVHWIAIS